MTPSGWWFGWFVGVSIWLFLSTFSILACVWFLQLPLDGTVI
jgi:hypothetical protein